MARQGIEISTALTPERLRAEARRARTAQAGGRMLAIANALDGMSRIEAARSVGMSNQALRDNILRYNAEGLEGLYDRPGRGRKCKLAPDCRTELAEIIRKGPDIEKDGLSAYTLEDLTKVVADKWGVSYHASSMSRIVRGLGFSRQKARKLHPSQDPASVEAFKKSPRNGQDGCGYT